MAQAFIALGSNLNNPKQQVLLAIANIIQLTHTRLIKHSSLYKTAPVGYSSQPDFINAVLEVDTSLSPMALLRELLKIEDKHGRERSFANAPRVLDCDLLLYDNIVMKTPLLTLPHPRMHERGFVMLPLAEISPDLELKKYGKAREIALRCENQGVEKLPS